MRAHPSSVSSVATRNGVIAGLVLGILSLPLISLSAVGRAAAASGLWPLFLLAALVAFAVAGFSASRRNGLLRSAVWAGFLTALITTFIALCLGVVILTLLAPYALLATPAARRMGHIAAAERVAFIRLALGGLILLVSGLIAGLVGGLLGRIGRRHDADGTAQGTATVASPVAAQTQGYAPPAQQYVGGHTPAPQAMTPPPYYPTATAYDDNTPTTVRDSQE
jgi:hypothetical protein